jgi:hypothetical protein
MLAQKQQEMADTENKRTSSGIKFEVKKWNAVALWSWSKHA